MKQDLADYISQKTNLEKAINGLSTQISKKEKERADKFRELLELEKQTTSIQPTLDGINALLSSFGFKSFGLAKGDDVRNNKGNIKQVFVLTHNIYFRKEVTYNSKRNSTSLLTEETFWLVKKSENKSVAEKQQNPIKTTYELLWAEVRNENRSNVTIQDTLRRILENYFKLLGGIPLDNLYLEFNGEDKIICKSLCSWINDGLRLAKLKEHAFEIAA